MSRIIIVIWYLINASHLTDGNVGLVVTESAYVKFKMISDKVMICIPRLL